jgi:hypothetical protein
MCGIHAMLMYSTCQSRSLKSHNCICGMSTVEKLMWYYTGIWTIPTEGPHGALWQSVTYAPLLMTSTSVSRWLSSVSAVLWIIMLSTCCRWAPFTEQSVDIWNHVWCVSVCSLSTTLPSGHGIILMLSSNVGVRSSSVWTFRLLTMEALLWAPICWQTDCWIIPQFCEHPSTRTH